MEKAAIGLGSNQGDSVRTCLDVIELLRKHPAVYMFGASSLYRTKPVGFAGQAWFINAAVVFETALEPRPLLELLLDIENNYGRVRTLRWGPRTLDLDMLYYGDRKVDLPDLVAPHPRLHERLFVLAPLAEIEPGWVHPVLGLSVQEMLDRLLQSDHGQEIQKLDI
ncbi:MAG: 2-amino-4-hydroxy-6-hydroxymethyldihydropteridine diphosphokinase [Syntrophobacteraceae bacterium]